jgi:pimeloyl-ACP methyl ester carboxylesterase
MSNEDEIQQITAKVAGRVATFAMLSSNSYHNDDRVRFEVERLGWIQVDWDGNPTNEPTKKHPLSGLAYDIFEKQGSNEVVFAFRGTDSKTDYLTANLAVPPFNFQYRQARKEFGRYLSQHSHKNAVVTGHSLGGGLALSVSVHHGVAAITFDPSPRIFDGIGDLHEPAERVIVYEDGEILQAFRKHWRKVSEVVQPKDIYRCSFNFAGSQHRSDYLALGLLKLGATVNPALKAVLDSLPSDKNV